MKSMFFQLFLNFCYGKYMPRQKDETLEEYYDRVNTDIEDQELKSLQHVLHTPSSSHITIVLEGKFAEVDKKFLMRRYSDINIVIKKKSDTIIKQPLVIQPQTSMVDFDQDYRHMGETLIQYMNRVITLLDDEDQIIDVYIDEDEDLIMMVTIDPDAAKRHYLQSRFSNCRVVYHNV